MARAPIRKDVQADVLLKSRRRCCICFGLGRDTSLKQGQIAHLDQNAANADEDNLAFLCLNHHDEYDGRTSQSKGLTIEEVRRFRHELYEAIGRAFSAEVYFGGAKATPSTSIAGHYIREGQRDSADIKLQDLGDGQFHVTGFALWGTDRAHGPNIGGLDFIAELKGDALEYSNEVLPGHVYRVRLLFRDGRLLVDEHHVPGLFGMNVHFGGEYARAT